jgi:hypothetical protein
VPASHHPVLDFVGVGVCLLETVSLRNTSGCPGTHSIDQAGFEHKRTSYLCLPEFWSPYPATFFFWGGGLFFFFYGRKKGKRSISAITVLSLCLLESNLMTQISYYLFNLPHAPPHPLPLPSAHSPKLSGKG